MANQHYDFDGDGKRDLATIGQLLCFDGQGERIVAYEELCQQGEVRLFRVDQAATSQGKIAKSILQEADKPYYQGVFYSSQVDETINMPPVIRLLDDAINDYHQGLVEVIAREDLRNTDIYVFRESTGDLLTERSGLSPAELRPDDGSSNDFDEADGNFHYRLQLRGGEEGYFRVGSRGRSAAYKDGEFVGYEAAFNTWQIDSGMNPKFHEREADHIRPGEPVRIILINRATGYMGSARTVLDVKDSITSLPSIWVPDIKMGPPNLKVWAEREFYVESGLTKDEGRQFLIGSEGAANASDLIIKVYTEWLDQDGSPLPEQLSDFGYTARVGKLTAANQVSDMSVESENGQSVRYFPIKPGKHLQLIRVSESGTGTQHLYVQVNGEPYIRSPDFSGDPKVNIEINRETNSPGVDFETLGAGDAQLISRPMRYVPVLTPIWDENTTLENQLYYNQWKNKQEEEDNQQVVNPLKPDPHYKWRYRPEFHFSIYDINPRDIRTYEETEDSIISESIIDAATPTISSGDEFIKFIYDLGDEVAAPNPLFSTEEKELILALGEEEIKLTYGSNNEVLISNLEHLAGLEAEDFLTARLYTNNDASNILWEWAFEYLDFYPVIDDDNLASEVDGAIEISADDTEIDLVAHLIGFANRSESSKYDVNILWKNEGSGTLATNRDVDGDYAIFKNTLTLPTAAGSTAKVSASLHSSEGAQTAGTGMLFRVVPGETKSVTAALKDSNDQIYIGGEGQVTIEGVAKDQFDNTVADGTAVTVATSGSIKLEQAPESTVDGAFSFVISGTDYAEASKVTVRVGEFDHDVDLTVNPVEIAFDGLPAEVDTNAKVDFAINVTAGGQPVKNYDFDVWAENARLTQSTIKTDANGRATLSLIAPPNEAAVKVKAMTAMQSPAVADVVVKFPVSGKPTLNTQFTKVVGDAATESAFQYTRWDNVSFSVNKAISGTVDVYGTANEQKTVTIGDIFAPNRLSQAAYWMNDVEEAKDEVGFSTGTLENIELSKDTRRFAGNSFAFNQGSGSSLMTVADAARLQLANNNSFVVDIKPTKSSGEIFNLGNGLKLELSAGVLKLTAVTDDGNIYTATQVNPLALSQWHQVAGSFANNTLTLAIGYERIETPITGNMVYGASSLKVGQGYSGLMNSLKWFNLASEPLSTFADGSETSTVTLDGTGKVTVAINSTGKMLSFSSQLPMQSITIQADNTRQSIELLSTAMFEQLAASTLSAGLVASAPDFDLTALDQSYSSSVAQVPSILQSEALFPKAHAYNIELTDVVAIAASLIGLDSLEVIWDQVGNMLAGKEVDIVAFSVAILDVLSLFPPAAPLKALTTPAKLAIKALRLGNNNAVKYMGGVLKKMFQQAKGKDFTLVYQGIAFLIIMADMYEDAEVREGLAEVAKMINSTDDFLDLLDYFALADDEIGLPDTSTTSLGSVDVFEQFAIAEFGLFPQAHAGVKKELGKAIGKAYKQLKPILKDLPEGTAAKTFGTFARTIKSLPPKERARFIKAAFNVAMIKTILVATKRGLKPENLKSLIKGHNGQRIPPIALMVIMGYLEDELSNGRLFKSHAVGMDLAKNENALKTLMLKAAPAFVKGGTNGNVLIRNANGAAFHLMHTAMLHASGQEIIGLEVPRDVVIFPTTRALKDKQITGKSLIFGRDVDIATKGKSGEIWHEVKSWKSKVEGETQTNKPYSATPWKWGTGDRKEDNTILEKAQGTAAHKQFTLDRIAAKVGVIKRKDDQAQTPNVNVSDFNWQFHKFVAKSKGKNTKGNVLAKSADLDLVKTEFEKKPTNVKDNFLKAHTGSIDAPTSKIKEGALGALLNIIQGELKEAVEEEKADFGYE